MGDDTIFVGLDVHKATVAVAAAEGMRGGEVRQLGAIPNRADHIATLAETLGKGARRLSFCYEAGPCGYGLHRQLTALGHDCMVVAPSLIPMKAGERVKTDRLDAVMLAKLHRAGELTAVWVEVGDFSRFDNPLQLMAHLGLVPSGHSSGATVRRGGIAKAGNALARRALIEGARTYRMQARVSRKLHDRIESLPRPSATPPGRPRSGYAPAIAREMVGFLWAIARQLEMIPAA